MTLYPIDKDVEYTKNWLGEKSVFVGTVEALEIGESFFVPEDDRSNASCSSGIYAIGRRMDRKFKSKRVAKEMEDRSIVKGTRIWRES